MEKKFDFFKTSKYINSSVECDRISKTSQNKIWVFFQKEKVFSIEKLIVFKNAECCKLPVECDWKSKVSQSIKNLRFLKKLHGFFEKKAWNLYKLLKVAKVKWNASEKSNTSQNI